MSDATKAELALFYDERGAEERYRDVIADQHLDRWVGAGGLIQIARGGGGRRRP